MDWGRRQTAGLMMLPMTFNQKVIISETCDIRMASEVQNFHFNWGMAVLGVWHSGRQQQAEGNRVAVSSLLHNAYLYCVICCQKSSVDA